MIGKAQDGLDMLGQMRAFDTQIRSLRSEESSVMFLVEAVLRHCKGIINCRIWNMDFFFL